MPYNSVADLPKAQTDQYNPHQKEAFLKAARAQGDADYAKQKASAPPDRPPPPTQRLKLQTDAVIDGLILKLEPKS